MKLEVVENVVLIKECPGLSPGHIAAFLERHQDKPRRQSGIYRNGSSDVDTDVRSCTSIDIDRADPFVVEVAKAIEKANEIHFKSNVTIFCKENELLQYDQGGKFLPHSDILYPPQGFQMDRKPLRKLTSIVMLSSPENFTGGQLRVWKAQQRFSFPWTQGDIVVFPSFVKHGVEPVETGLRHTLVSWSHGVY